MKQSDFTKNSKQFHVDQYLPHNFLAEKMILSCLLINSEAIDITMRTITVDVFYFKNHQELYKAIVFMYKNNLPIDILTLITFLQDNGLLEKIGGLKVLIELLKSNSKFSLFRRIFKINKRQIYSDDRLIKLGYEVINSGYITNIPLENILNNLENKLFNLTSEIKSQKLFSSAELLNDIFSELKTKSLDPKLSGLVSGFDALDSITQGLQKSDLIIIAGRPSTGKTALSFKYCFKRCKKLQITCFIL